MEMQGLLIRTQPRRPRSVWRYVDAPSIGYFGGGYIEDTPVPSHHHQGEFTYRIARDFPRGGGARGISGTIEEQDIIVRAVFVQWTIVPLCMVADGERMVSTVPGE